MKSCERAWWSVGITAINIARTIRVPYPLATPTPSTPLWSGATLPTLPGPTPLCSRGTLPGYCYPINYGNTRNRSLACRDTGQSSRVEDIVLRSYGFVRLRLLYSGFLLPLRDGHLRLYSGLCICARSVRIRRDGPPDPNHTGDMSYPRQMARTQQALAPG